MKRSGVRVLWVIVGVAILWFAGWNALEWRLSYRWPGFPSARSPSLRLELAERLGLRRFHSQFGQDKWILGVKFRGVTDGYFVDVGAGDADWASNSKALEDAGWVGVCVDPFPTGDWSKRKAKLLREVVYSEPHRRVQFRTAGMLGGIEEHVDASKNEVQQSDVVEFETTTLSEILDRVQAPRFIHYLSLDTEGSEYEILKSFPFDRHRVGAVTIEHNGEEPKRSLVRDLLKSHGYRFVKQQVVEDWYELDPNVGKRAPRPGS